MTDFPTDLPFPRADTICGFCRFCNVLLETPYGECRRYPPAANEYLGRTGGGPWFPIVNRAGDWCGEWKASERHENARKNGQEIATAAKSPDRE